MKIGFNGKYTLANLRNRLEIFLENKAEVKKINSFLTKMTNREKETVNKFFNVFNLVEK